MDREGRGRRNVNNWHWQEKDAFEWSRSRFAHLRSCARRDGADGVALDDGRDVVTGEAYVNRRKGKIIAGYELELKMAYEGEVDGAKVTGNVHFYVADENAFEAPRRRSRRRRFPRDRKARR